MDDKQEGTVLNGRYKLARKLGEGGFGVVFRAEHVAFGVSLRDVAVKFSKKPLTDAEARSIFADAVLLARLTDQCSDPTIRQHFVSLYDAGRCEEEGPFQQRAMIVMEYVPSSLADRLEAGPFPLTRAIRCLEQMTKAIAFMHQGITHPDGRYQPIIHRDLKPDNILVGVVGAGKERTEVLKVTDFGFAVSVDNLLGWTETGGTLTYWPPESLPHGYASPASDVYALGLIFYEMLAGANPFSKIGAHLIGPRQQREQELATLHLRARELESFPVLQRHEELQEKPELVRVIRKALAFSPTERYADARLLYADLQQALERKEVVPPPVTPSSPWTEVRKLVREARQFLLSGQLDHALALAEQAMTINRDTRRVPNSQVVGEAYELLVQLKIRQKQIEEAGQIAAEGYSRRKCRGTCQAMGWYYQACQSPTAASFFEEARKYPVES
ncbi:MAG: serine/threonine protein kinase [Deltaproteobacteria bacterium]|nr:serine/threonine protein kinase [Deltaproteobacteria bacterium]